MKLGVGMLNQKEGNGNIHMVLRIQHRSVINIRNISSFEQMGRMKRGNAYQNSWIVGDVGRCGLFWLLIFDNLDVFYIAASEDDELEPLLRRRDKFVDRALLGSER